MLQFIPIASSSAGCSYLLTHDKDRSLLIDCGAPIAAVQAATGFQLTQLAGCLLSHAHGDHCKHAMALAKYGVNLFATADTFAQMGVTGHHRTRTIRESDQFKVGPWKVTPFPVVHDCPGTLGFVVEGSGGALLYLTDTAYSKLVFKGLTHIAVEANWDEEILRQNADAGLIDNHRTTRTASNHMSIQRAVKMLEATDLSTVQEIWLLHLSDQNSNAEAFKDLVQRKFGIPTYVAQRSNVEFAGGRS